MQTGFLHQDYFQVTLFDKQASQLQLFCDSVWISSEKPNPPPALGMRRLRLPVQEALC